MISPDVVQATDESTKFVECLTQKTRLIKQSDTSFTLEIGADNWPFPMPLVKKDGKWFFDTDAGKQEILCRRIGRDEIGAMKVCRAYVAAQREYASEDRRGDGVIAYAQLLHSTVGKHDGLYWRSKPGETLSPFGPLITDAHAAGYLHTGSMLDNKQRPYHGYYFKILTRQGKSAPCGAYNYVINGHMIAGFALIAWPAEWGNTGVMTFIVNQDGKVYQRNFGEGTSLRAAAIQEYNPSTEWALVQIQPNEDLAQQQKYHGIDETQIKHTISDYIINHGVSPRPATIQITLDNPTTEKPSVMVVTSHIEYDDSSNNHHQGKGDFRYYTDLPASEFVNYLEP